MRTRLLPLLACLVLPVEGRSQAIEIGAKSGLAQTSLTSGREFTWTGSNPSSALFLRLAFAPGLAVQTEAVMSRRLGVSRIAGTSLTMQADYLEAPLLLQWEGLSLGRLSAYLTGGPVVAYRFSCRLRFDGGGVTFDDECDTARGVRSSRVDIGGTAGAGVRYSLGFVNVQAEARANRGLATNILPIDSSSARSQGWSMMLGASVPLSRMRRASGPVPGTTVPRRPLPVASLPVESQRQVASAAEPVALPAVAGPVRISVDADDVDLGDVVSGIANATKTSITLDPRVRRRVTLALRDVTAEEAMQAIAYRTGLGMVREVENGRSVIALRPVTPASR